MIGDGAALSQAGIVNLAACVAESLLDTILLPFISEGDSVAKDMGATSDYSSVAQWYDSTRSMPADLLDVCFRRFREQVPFEPPRKILDAGCGTAQLSLPLMRAGYSVIGVDVSDAMLQFARDKSDPQWDVEYLVADVRDLQFSDSHFDAVVVSKLFQHVSDWRSAVAEIQRVTRPGGYLLHINEKGAFKNAVRRRFADECDSRGLKDRYHGLRDRTELAKYVVSLGAKRVELDVNGLAWVKNVGYREAFHHLELKLHSEFWSISDDEYRSILDSVHRWIHEQVEGMDTVEEMRPFLTAEIFCWAEDPPAELRRRRPAAGTDRRAGRSTRP